MYRQESGAVNNGSASIGLAGPSSGDFLSLNGTGSSPSASSVTETTNLSGKPATGQIYTWTPPTCFMPTAVTSSAVTTTTATISWTAASPAPANGYQYEIRTSGAVGSGATGLILNGTTIAGDVNDNISGLSASTTYYVYVRSDCGSGDYSSWVGPYEFTTTQVPGTLTYTEDFESWPTGWTVVNGSETNHWEVGTATAASGTTSAYISDDGGTNNSYSHTATTVHLYRDISFPAGSNPFNLQFKWKADGESSYDYIRVHIIAPSTVPAEGVLLNSGQLGSYLNQETTWQTENIQLDAATYAGAIWRLVFTWKNDASGGTQPPAAIDDIEIKVITCPAPTALTASSTIPTEAVLSWTENGSATVWDIEGGLSGFTPTGTPNFPSVSNSYTVTGLTGSTDYEYYVRADCGGSDNSTWSGPYTFTTAAPYMTYTSSTTTQPVTTDVSLGSTNQQIICIQVVTTGSTNPLNLTSIRLNALGSTDILDINTLNSAKIYYTGTNNTFSTATLFGQNTPTTANYFITGNRKCKS